MHCILNSTGPPLWSNNSTFVTSSAINGDRVGKCLVKNRLAEPQESRVVRRNLGRQRSEETIRIRLQFLKSQQHHGRNKCLLERRVLQDVNSLVLARLHTTPLHDIWENVPLLSGRPARPEWALFGSLMSGQSLCSRRLCIRGFGS